MNSKIAITAIALVAVIIGMSAVAPAIAPGPPNVPPIPDNTAVCAGIGAAEATLTGVQTQLSGEAAIQLGNIITDLNLLLSNLGC